MLELNCYSFNEYPAESCALGGKISCTGGPLIVDSAFDAFRQLQTEKTVEPVQHDSKSCDGNCAKCGLSEADVRRADAAGLSGWRMTVATCSCFLLPLVLAALGAWLLGSSGAGQALGAVAGLVLGGLLGALVMRTFLPSEEKS